MKKFSKTRHPFVITERKVMLKVAKTHPHGPLIELMLYTGERPREAAAMSPAQIDFAKRTITIDRAIHYDAALRPFMGPAKTSRVVPLPEPLIPVLLKHCAGKGDDELLFPDDNGGLPTMKTLRKWEKSFFRQCQLEAGAQLNKSGNIIQNASSFSSKMKFIHLRHMYLTDLIISRSNLKDFTRVHVAHTG